MTEHKLFQGDVPHVSTFAFHEHRDRAPHLEQEGHRPRLLQAAEFIRDTVRSGELDTPVSWSDLGCGDGGLLQLLDGEMWLDGWGYDFTPANAAGWSERGVEATALDVFGADRDQVKLGQIVSMTEVLEHLADPHGVLRWVRGGSERLVCSSPWNENTRVHDECHAWAWDMDGYAAMIRDAGWEIFRHAQVGTFQVVLAR